MDHHFTDNRHLAKNRKEISFRFWCFSASSITDNGVFSKDNVDFGIRVLLNALYEHEGELGNQSLDMGYGYGVMRTAIKKAWPDKRAKMVDVNPRAVELVRDNVEKNNIETNIHISSVYEQVSGNTFTDIMTDPPIRTGKNVVYNVFEGTWNHLADQGTLWVVIRRQQGVHSTVTKIKEAFGNYDIIHKGRGYLTLRAKKALTI